MKDYIHYIIRFLLGDTIPGELIPAIGYTSDRRQYGKYSIVIHPSGFFDNGMYGKPESLPALPLKSIEDTPLLFGEATEEMVDDTLVLHADLVAGTFFLISRYEEMVRRGVRDEHGRFPGKESLPFRAGFIHRPIVEEYGLYLRNKLRRLGARLPEEKSGVQKVYLTHDVDAPFFCRTWRSVLRETMNRRDLLNAIKNKRGKLEEDPYYTFPELFAENDRLRETLGEKRCRTVCFFKAGGNTSFDKPVYSLRSKDMKALFALCEHHQVEAGLHSSYQAGTNPRLIDKEKRRLEAAVGKKVHLNRHHFLSVREPEDVVYLQKAGIDQDFTSGYADVAGFRLGTCRPVYWINPAIRRLTPLLLHPLTIMDTSLCEEKYMNLTPDEALNYCSGLIAQTAAHRGDVVLLWHNTSIPQKSFKTLYTELLSLIAIQGANTYDE